MITTKILAGGALVAALALGGCGSSGGDRDPGSTPAPTASSAPSASSTGAAAAPAEGPHGDADVAFASMMIPHHRQAIEMSTMLLAKSGVDPKVTALAERIKAAQAPEVAQMSGWLAGWGADPSPSAMGGMGGMDHGAGTMSDSAMKELEAAPGAQAGRLFLTGMVGHHQGALTMAQTELDAGQNPAARELAQEIISTQQAEIAEMNRMLGREPFPGPPPNPRSRSGRAPPTGVARVGRWPAGRR